MSENENLINPLENTNNITNDLSLFPNNLNSNEYKIKNTDNTNEDKINYNLIILNNSNNSNKIIYNDLNIIINDCGYNLITFKNIFFCFLFCIYEGFILSFFGNIATAFQQYYNISYGLLSFISSVVFLGMGIGSSTVNLLLKIMSRRQVILHSIIGIILANLLTSFIHNIVIFTIFRFISSIFLGFYMILSFNILTEYLPVKYRGFVMNNVWLGWSFGGIYFLFFCKIYIPYLSYDPLDKKTPQNFHMAFFSLFYLLIIGMILIFFFLKDSPRNLILNNKLEEAGEILEYYINRKLTKEELDTMHYNLLNSGENLHGKKNNDYKLLFSKRYLKMSILMMSIFFLYSFSGYGMLIALPTILDDINKLETPLKKNENKSAQINSLILIFFISSLSSPLGGIFAEFKYIGKKNSSIILNIFSIIFCGFGMIFKSHFDLLFSISSLVGGCAFNLHINWASEILPTKIRDLGLGSFMGVSRIGGFTSQYIFIALVHSNIDITIYTYLFSLLIIIILLCFLPKNEINELDSSLELSESNAENENEDENLNLNLDKIK